MYLVRAWYDVVCSVSVTSYKYEVRVRGTSYLVVCTSNTCIVYLARCKVWNDARVRPDIEVIFTQLWVECRVSHDEEICK